MSKYNPEARILFTPSTYRIGSAGLEAYRQQHGIKRRPFIQTESDYRFTEQDWNTYDELKQECRFRTGIEHVPVTLDTVYIIVKGIARIAHANLNASIIGLDSMTDRTKFISEAYLMSVRRRGEAQRNDYYALNDCVTEAQRSGTAIFLTGDENESIVTSDIQKRYTAAA